VSTIKVDTIQTRAGASEISITTLKADTIQNTSGTSEIGIDTLKGASSAGSMSVVGEGGSTTTNLQQGLLKAWVFSAVDAGLTDSLNLASGTDNGTGNYTFAFTNNMGDANGSGAGSVTDNTDRTATIHTRSTSSYVVNVYNQGGSAQDSRNRTMINGDLA